MTTVINGSDNSASTPALTGTDTDTGVFFPAANTMGMSTGGTERMRIDSSGNVGIGTSSPLGKLHVSGGASNANFYLSNNSYSSYYYQNTGGSSGVDFPSSQAYIWSQGSTERMRIDSIGNVGIGTSSPSSILEVSSQSGTLTLRSPNNLTSPYENIFNTSYYAKSGSSTVYEAARISVDHDNASTNIRSGAIKFYTHLSGAITESMRIDSSGNLLVGKTSTSLATQGCELRPESAYFTRSGGAPLFVNRATSDGTIVDIRQDNTTEGTISVSGTTVSYNGGNLSRFAQLTVPKDETNLLKGTVMSNLDEMNVYIDADGNPVDNEQLNKVKVSDVEGDANVAGVFVNWSYDEAHSVDEINMAMTGDMIIRIAEGVTVARGDLLMSAGDGTAKPQGDDIVRSKTIAKVTSTHVTYTYDDGSYCVPCVLMAC